MQTLSYNLQEPFQMAQHMAQEYQQVQAEQSELYFSSSI